MEAHITSDESKQGFDMCGYYMAEVWLFDLS